MAKFDATVVEPMEFDFTPFVQGTDAATDPTVKGAVPEPSHTGILRFLEAQNTLHLEEQEFSNQLQKGRDLTIERLWRDAHPDEDFPGVEKAELTPAQMIELYASDGDEREAFRLKMHERYVDVIAEACQGCPSRTVLAALPHRQLQGFSGWLTGQFSPETVAAAISR